MEAKQKSGSARATAARVQTPVTVLCGFLGAGKTTLLRHLLAQAGRAGEDGGPVRWAAVVNDVAAVNVDAALVRADDASRAAPGAEGAAEVVELGNGCVCCSGADDLGETIARLALSGRYEHIWVETSGVADPRGVATLFTRKNPFGKTLSDYARLAALVTVIDVVALAGFAAEAAAAEIPGDKILDPKPLNPKETESAGAERSGTADDFTPLGFGISATGAPRRRLVAGSGERPVFELMVEQIECADVVVLNQCDRATEAGGEIARAEALATGLNERAEIVRTERGQVAAEFFTGRLRFDPAATLGSARWVRDLNRAAVEPAGIAARGRLAARPRAEAAARPYHESRYGITSFVYRARAPFDADRLRTLFADGLPGVLRAKGFFWTTRSPDEMGFVSVAGGVVRWEILSVWWAARIEAGRARPEDRPPSVVAHWAEPHGDRRQEIVLIGAGLDETALTDALDACLL